MIQPCRARASARAVRMRGPASASGPEIDTSCGIPAKAVQAIWIPSGGRVVNAQSPSSITTSVVPLPVQPFSRRSRPVVIVTGAPTAFSGIACAAHSAWTEVMPGTTRRVTE